MMIIFSLSDVEIEMQRVLIMFLGDTGGKWYSQDMVLDFLVSKGKEVFISCLKQIFCVMFSSLLYHLFKI